MVRTLRSRPVDESNGAIVANDALDHSPDSRKRKRINSRRDEYGHFIVSGLSLDDMSALGWDLSAYLPARDGDHDSASISNSLRKRRKLSPQSETKDELFSNGIQAGENDFQEYPLDSSGSQVENLTADAPEATMEIASANFQPEDDPTYTVVPDPSELSPSPVDWEDQDEANPDDDYDDDEAADDAADAAAEDAANTPPPANTDPNELTEEDLAPPFLSPPSQPPSPTSDPAAHILFTKFLPIQPPKRIIDPLTSHDPSIRSTATLHALAVNTQRTLLAWQDEFLRLDTHTAPVASNPPKKPATGGRPPVSAAAFEAAKEAELFAAGGLLAAFRPVYPKPAPPHSTSTTIASNGAVVRTVAGAPRSSAAPTPPPRGEGRELRHRRKPVIGDSVLDGLGISEDDAGGASGAGKRARRPARRFEVGQNDENGERGGGRGRGRGRGRGGRSADEDRGTVARRGGAAVNGETRRRRAGGARGKSEKRSESMTAWWAERKRKAAEAKLREQQERERAEEEARRRAAEAPAGAAPAAPPPAVGVAPPVHRPPVQLQPQPVLQPATPWQGQILEYNGGSGVVATKTVDAQPPAPAPTSGQRFDAVRDSTNSA